MATLFGCMIKAAVGNVGVNINNFLCTVWERSHNTHRQLLVTWAESMVRSQSFPNMPLYLGLVKITPVLFAQSGTLSALSVLIDWSTLHVLATACLML